MLDVFIIKGSSLVLLSLCIAACCYYLYATYLAFEFFNPFFTSKTETDFQPAVTILKPLCGSEENLYQNLASFCQQNYGTYQIVFAVRESSDPSIEVVKKLIHDYPEIDITLVVDERIIGYNLKISNLANAVTNAKYETLIIADSDIRVQPDYIARVVQPLVNPEVGVVTCLYRSLAYNWLSIFEALGSSSRFHGGVFVARKLQGMNFTFGATIVIRAKVLESIGGFKAIADYLADDYQLGNLSVKAGYKVVLSDYITEHQLNTTNLREFINRQLRWNRCIWAGDPWGYVGLILTYGTLISSLFWLISGTSSLGTIILVSTWSLRLLMAWVIGVCCIKDQAVSQGFWLLPLHDLVSFGLWCYGFFGRTVRWRGQVFRLIEGGKMISCSDSLQDIPNSVGDNLSLKSSFEKAEVPKQEAEGSPHT